MFKSGGGNPENYEFGGNCEIFKLCPNSEISQLWGGGGNLEISE